MSISDLQRASIARQLTEYCAPDPRPEVRRQLRHGFELGPHDIVLFDERPRFDRSREWLRHDVARFRWFQSRREWQLYCQFSDLKWHLYEPRPSAKKFETLLAEVDADPTGIFWG
jgi:hypothetical protein